MLCSARRDGTDLPRPWIQRAASQVSGSRAATFPLPQPRPEGASSAPAIVFSTGRIRSVEERRHLRHDHRILGQSALHQHDLVFADLLAGGPALFERAKPLDFQR